MPIIPPSGAQQLTAQEAAGIHNANITEEDYPIKTSQFTDTLAGYAPLEALADYLKEVDTYFKSPTAQSQVNYASIADVQNKIIGRYIPTVSFEAGDCVVPSFNNILTKLKLVGDTRSLVGLTYVHGETIQSTAANCGSGAVSLSSSGNTVTVAGSTTNPDFSQLVNGNKCLFCNTSGTLSILTVDSVSGHQITFTTAAPTINAEGASMTIIPNRRITSQVVIPLGIDVIFQGFYFDSIRTSPGIDIFGSLTLQNCVVYSGLDINCHARPFASLNVTDSTIANIYNTWGANGRCAIYVQCGASCKILKSHFTKHYETVYCHMGKCTIDNSCFNYSTQPLKTRRGGNILGANCFLCQGATGISAELTSSGIYSNMTIHYFTCGLYSEKYASLECLTSYALRSNVSTWAITSGGDVSYN